MTTIGREIGQIGQQNGIIMRDSQKLMQFPLCVCEPTQSPKHVGKFLPGCEVTYLI
jgi:hypothetical protein